MVERLQNHGNKPFIRGGDFMMRKAGDELPAAWNCWLETEIRWARARKQATLSP